jgi:hypothetical protein
MARVPRSFVAGALWPEFQALDEALREHLAAVTNSIVSQGVSSDISEPEVVPELGTGGEGAERR